MFTKALFGTTCFLAGVILAIGVSSWSQPYVGGSLGLSTEYGLGTQPDHNSHDGCSQNDSQQTHDVGSLFAGYRAGYVGVEAGTGSLFHMHYKADCPWNLFTQDFRGSYRYLRVSGYVPLSRGFDLVPFFGAAVVKYTNFEDARYRAPYLTPEHVTNLSTGRHISPLFGIGVEKNLGKWFLRGEFQQVNNVGEDPWTARGWHNIVQTVSVGIGRYF